MFHWLKRLWQRLFGDVQDEPGDSSDSSQKEASGESKFKVIECEILDIEDEDDIIDCHQPPRINTSRLGFPETG